MQTPFSYSMTMKDDFDRMVFLCMHLYIFFILISTLPADNISLLAFPSIPFHPSSRNTSLLLLYDLF